MFASETNGERGNRQLEEKSLRRRRHGNSTTVRRASPQGVAHAREASSDVLAQELRAELGVELVKGSAVERDGISVAFEMRIVRGEHDHLRQLPQHVEAVTVAEAGE